MCVGLFEVPSLPTLVSNVDFELTKSTLRFRACETSQCLNVTIINDNTLEGSETFTVNLQKSDSLSTKFTVNPSSEVVTIVDDDGMYVCTNNTSGGSFMLVLSMCIEYIFMFLSQWLRLVLQRECIQ